MGSVYLRGKSYVGQYKDRGRTVQKTLGKKGIITKTAARAMLVKIEERVKLKQYELLDAEIPTLEDFANEYLSYVRDTVKKRSWKRDELCLRHLKSFYKSRILTDIKSQDVDDYKSLRLKKVSAATVNRELEVLRHLFNLADRWGMHFGRNPVSRAGLLPLNNQMERILTLEEERRLLSVCDTYLRNIVITALYTGMRKGELLTLKWENIDLVSNLITIDQTNSKSKKTRRVPINSGLRTLLLYQKLNSAGSKYVFHNSKGTPYLRQDSLNRAFRLALRKAEIEGLRFHDLRHTAATRMIESGASIVAVSKILGHADLKTTMRYAHPDDSLKNAVELLAKPNFSDPATDKSTDI